ncbi:MAG: hypothetical protein WAT93_02365 [Pontixanthobacter sp.]
MENEIEKQADGAQKPFVKPELKVLDVKHTQTGGSPDPNEFNPFLQAPS